MQLQGSPADLPKESPWGGAQVTNSKPISCVILVQIRLETHCTRLVPPPFPLTPSLLRLWPLDAPGRLSHTQVLFWVVCTGHQPVLWPNSPPPRPLWPPVYPWASSTTALRQGSSTVISMTQQPPGGPLLLFCQNLHKRLPALSHPSWCPALRWPPWPPGAPIHWSHSALTPVLKSSYFLPASSGLLHPWVHRAWPSSSAHELLDELNWMLPFLCVYRTWAD